MNPVRRVLWRDRKRRRREDYGQEGCQYCSAPAKEALLDEVGDDLAEEAGHEAALCLHFAWRKDY